MYSERQTERRVYHNLRQLLLRSCVQIITCTIRFTIAWTVNDPLKYMVMREMFTRVLRWPDYRLDACRQHGDINKQMKAQRGTSAAQQIITSVLGHWPSEQSHDELERTCRRLEITYVIQAKAAKKQQNLEAAKNH